MGVQFPGVSNPDYSAYIHLSRYSRWLDTEKRRERWDETVTRYCDFWKKRFPEVFPYQKIHRAILNLDVMPSMRCMMTAGAALERDEMAGFNPVVGSTLVQTRTGVYPIRDLVGTMHEVLNKEGRWAQATFRSYGTQPVLRVSLKRNSNTRSVVDCTANHRWVLVNGTVIPTSDLKPGMQLPFASAPKPSIDADYRRGVQHGFIYGDGAATRSCGRVKGYHIRICGDAEDVLPWFSEYPVSYAPSAGGDPIVMMYDSFAKTHDLKVLPDSGETESYLLGFLRGWFAADGSISTGSQSGLCTDEKGKEWLFANGGRFGFLVQRTYKLPKITNYGERTRDTYQSFFSRTALTHEDFLLSRKRARFSIMETHFSVSEVTSTPALEEVFCAEVPDTNTFVLHDGLVTGNCSALPIDHIRAFDEVLYVLMCGTGVGFSVEKRFVSKLPIVGFRIENENPVFADQLEHAHYTIVVADSKIGWANAFHELLTFLYSGYIPTWDLSRIRPAGAPLKTMGGRASGPTPLDQLFVFTTSLFSKACGRKLTPIEAHDLVCKIADIVVVGGVRRSALISLSDLGDTDMRDAKSGLWYDEPARGIVRNGHRALANNSAVYEERPTMSRFFDEWSALFKSGSGERGIFNREALREKLAERGKRNLDHIFLTNPCAEIVLRPYGLCNLSEVIVRSGDDEKELKRKTEIATIIGTFQSTLTNFRYVRDIWRKNAEEERLLGVSMTGIMDNPLLGVCAVALTERLGLLRAHTEKINAHWAEKLGISASLAITTVKPSGTVSQLVDSASGIHPRHARYYIRRAKTDNTDPLGTFMKTTGFPHEDSAYKPGVDTVFTFPMKAPENAVLRSDVTAIEQLEHYKIFRSAWCDHNPSITISVRESEWMEVGAWVYKNFNHVGGVSFLPFADHIYVQAPFEEIDETAYKNLLQKMPTDVDWGILTEENGEAVTGTRDLSCVSGACEVNL